MATMEHAAAAKTKHIKARETAMTTAYIQDRAYAIHAALARLHRDTNAWRDLGAKDHLTEHLIISLRETAAMLNATATRIESEMRAKVKEKADLDLDPVGA